MAFNSLAFFIFFPVVTAVYFLLPQKPRVVWLLLASCAFYMAFIPKYILILAVTIVVDYFAGRAIENVSGSHRKLLLVISLISNLGFLFFFKYFGFATSNLNALAAFLHWNYSVPLLKIVLPLGLSFHTFQAMSYTIEVYRGKVKAEKHFLTYALYVMFFPQLVAGPIERPQNLLPQFYIKHEFEYERVTSGLKLIAWGLLKKVVIADRLALVVNNIFISPHAYSGPQFVVASVFFAFQIYCDFSGYSEIAIGSAQVLGFKLMNNFNRPYFAKSIAEFWRRWHISLSSWFRDYLYIPLGGNRVSGGRWAANIFLVFLLSGLWHGANWTYLVWGALHGLYIIFGRLGERIRRAFWQTLGRVRPRSKEYVQMAVTFILVTFAWIFFRAASLGDAGFIIGHLFSGWGVLPSQLSQNNIFALGVTMQDLLLSLLLIIGLVLVQLAQRGGDIRDALAKQPVWVRWGVYYAVALALLFLSVPGGPQFIYFQF